MMPPYYLIKTPIQTAASLLWPPLKKIFKFCKIFVDVCYLHLYSAQMFFPCY